MEANRKVTPKMMRMVMKYLMVQRNDIKIDYSHEAGMGTEKLLTVCLIRSCNAEKILL